MAREPGRAKAELMGDHPGQAWVLLYRRLKRDPSGERIIEEVEFSPQDAAALVRRWPHVWARTPDGHALWPWERKKPPATIEQEPAPRAG